MARIQHSPFYFIDCCTLLTTMTETNPGESPLEVAAEVTGGQLTSMFELLGNETRLAILLALWEAIEPFDDERGGPVPFSVLREDVGMKDSGQFNYHLGKLEGYFVEQTADGYKLLPAGERLVRTIIAIAGYDEASFEPIEIDFACPECGAPTAVTYGNQRLYHVCTACEGTYQMGEKDPSGVLSAWTADPSALRGRTAESVYNVIGTQVTLHAMGQLAAGICPWCFGEVETRLHVCEDHEPGTEGGCPACGRQYDPAVRILCSVCKFHGQTNIPQWSLNHPAVVGFYWRHGIELGYTRFDLDTAEWRWSINEEVDEEVVSVEPPRVHISFSEGGEQLRLAYDEALNVVEVNEDY